MRGLSSMRLRRAGQRCVRLVLEDIDIDAECIRCGEMAEAGEWFLKDSASSRVVSPMPRRVSSRNLSGDSVNVFARAGYFFASMRARKRPARRSVEMGDVGESARDCRSVCATAASSPSASGAMPSMAGAALTVVASDSSWTFARAASAARLDTTLLATWKYADGDASPCAMASLPHSSVAVPVWPRCADWPMLDIALWR